MSKFIPRRSVEREHFQQMRRLQNKARAFKEYGDKLAKEHGLEPFEYSQKTKEGNKNE